MEYAWHKPAWNTFATIRSRLPHALLMQGKRGIGKRDFAEAIARLLLCEAPISAELACGHCASCNWFAAGTHPDFRLIEPEAPEAGAEEAGGEKVEKKRTELITVAQIREALDFVTISSSRNGFRVVLIVPAENMNTNAANALLKMLEEPPAQTLFILVTHHPQRLPATVRSRCHRFVLSPPPHAAALHWLQAQGVNEAESCLAQAGFSPLQAQRLSAEDYQEKRRLFLSALCSPEDHDPLSLAESAEKLDLSWPLNWLQTWVCDLAYARLAGVPRYQMDFSVKIVELSARLDLKRLFSFQRELAEAQALLRHPLNTRLLLEQLLLSYYRLARR